MPSTDPLDYVKRHIRWPYDRLRERYFSPRKNPLPIPDTGIFDSPYACVKINYKWVSHLIGIVETLLDLDSWVGTEEEQYAAKQEVEKLLATLGAACPEEEIVTSFRFTVGCGMEYSNDNGETWLPVPGWGDFAEACFQGDEGDTGPSGPPGATGPTGPEGPPGDDCDCSIVPTQPPIPADPDPFIRDQQACAISRGVGSWLYNTFNDALLVIVAGVEAAKIIEGIVSDLIDAIPVIGALVDALLDFATNVVSAIASELLAANGFYFMEMIQCELYRIMKCDDDDFTVEYLAQVKQELQDWGAVLPPQTPLVVLIGQAFALFLETVPDEELLRRANAYKTSSPDCDLCETEDCPSDACAPVTIDWDEIGETPDGWAVITNPESIEWTGDTEFLFTNSADDNISYGGASRASNADWTNTMVGAGDPRGIWLEYTFPEPCTIDDARVQWSATAGNSKAAAIAIETPTGEHVIIARFYDPTPAPMTGELTYSDPVVEAVKIYFAFASNNGAGSQTIRITTSRVNGT